MFWLLIFDVHLSARGKSKFTGPGVMEVRDVGFLMLALPRTLTHLEGVYVKEPKFVALLPRTLKNCDFLRDIRTFTADLALALPPALNAVYCSRMGGRGSLSVDITSFENTGQNFEKSLPGLLMLVMENRHKDGSFFCNPCFVAFKKLPKTEPTIYGSSFVI